jgi:hypothetical protein
MCSMLEVELGSLGPYFAQTINSSQYITRSDTIFLTPVDYGRTYAPFQQGSATSQNDNNFMCYLQNVFGDRVISEELWPLIC